MARILMVDGDPDVVHAGRIILEKEGFTVAEARGPEGTLTACAQFHPDLVFVDVMHREVEEGREIARHIRGADLQMPILILGTVDRSTDFFVFQEDDSLERLARFPEKPMEPAALVKNVKLLLDSVASRAS